MNIRCSAVIANQADREDVVNEKYEYETMNIIYQHHILNITMKQKDQLENLIHMRIADVLFDSDIDDWNQNTSILNQLIMRKKQLLFFIEDEDGEKFGYYYQTEIREYYEARCASINSFHFNLESNGRLLHPMKFEMKSISYSGCEIFEPSDERLIQIGNITLFKQNKKQQSNCYQKDFQFNYHDIECAICGKYNFTPKRILVFQMMNNSISFL